MTTRKKKSPKRAPSTPKVQAAQPPSAREKMVLAAVSLLSERGLAGTSFNEVIERSGAPRGSIYHHFPEGKDRLAEEAIAAVERYLLALLRRREAKSPQEVVRSFVAAWRDVLVRSNCKGGCAVAAVGNERLEHPALGARAGAIFVAWEKELKEALIAAGLARQRAGNAAVLILAGVEGALVLARARGELKPLEAVGEALETFVA